MEHDDFYKYEAVNLCENLDELAHIIESFADENGDIQGRVKKFNAKTMANACRNYNWYSHNTLTREFGIRQQAMMLLFYKDPYNKSIHG